MQQQVEEKIEQAFSKVPYPGDGHIAYHQCDECDWVREDFRGQSPASLNSATVEYHYDSLPLLSPTAYHFFLPAYLFYALDKFDSNVTRYLLFNLSMDTRKERLRLFNKGQKEAVATFLECLRSIDEYGEYVNEITTALNVW